ncbi:MAG: hypothetical protein H6713_23450 [Myxococcales bacterium]|nr:hypothetical protein [Myxococcales bacterium]MCB9752922.1 hypothetical protein [Myxococcales bacterium]
MPSKLPTPSPTRGASRRAARALACATAIAASLLASTASAAKPRRPGDDRGRVGVGAVLGAPSGFTLKGFLAPRHALQLDLGYGPLQNGGGRAHLDYLLHPGAVARERYDFAPYLGVGVGFEIWVVGPHGPHLTDHAHTAWFVRAPALGFAFHLHRVPLDIFLEGAWTPLKHFNGDREWSLTHGDVSVGVRWYFGPPAPREPAPSSTPSSSTQPG